MTELDKNLISIDELSNLLSWVKKLEPILLKDFITYWSIRKSPNFVASSLIKEIKARSPNSWIAIIESNHKFRDAYGEEKANELVEIITTSFLFQAINFQSEEDLTV